MAARAQLLPLAELTLAAITGPVLLSIRMELGMFVESHPALRVLPAKHTTALAAMMTAVEDAKRSLAGGCGANSRGIIRLQIQLAPLDEALLSTDGKIERRGESV